MNGIVFRGVCQYLSTSGAVMCEVGPGQFFGDLPMIFEEKHLASVRSKTNVEVIRKPTRVFSAPVMAPSSIFMARTAT